MLGQGRRVWIVNRYISSNRKGLPVGHGIHAGAREKKWIVNRYTVHIHKKSCIVRHSARAGSKGLILNRYIYTDKMTRPWAIGHSIHARTGEKGWKAKGYIILTKYLPKVRVCMLEQERRVNKVHL